MFGQEATGYDLFYEENLLATGILFYFILFILYPLSSVLFS